MNSTSILLVEGRGIALCVELVQSTSQSAALEPLRIIEVVSRPDSQYDNGKFAWFWT